MELFDIVNESDEVIGKATREECHTNPSLIHRAVHFTLLNPQANTYLLTRRARNLKYDAGKLCFLGEHVKHGESWEEAVKRGVNEELGFEPSTCKETAHHIFSYTSQTEFVRFFVITWNHEALTVEEEEIEEVMWLPLPDIKQVLDELSEMTKFWVARME